ncbi:hypothetical protein HY572_02430 [Candidatus Micrarchaeota archaeon]|nr:hypothetical protein [Candidatus Micrarchaeota archaeon]
MKALSVAFRTVKTKGSEFRVTAWQNEKESGALLVRFQEENAYLVPDPKALKIVHAHAKGQGLAKALVAYAVGVARKQGAKNVVFANIQNEELAEKLAGNGRVTSYHEFGDAAYPERFQIQW